MSDRPTYGAYMDSKKAAVPLYELLNYTDWFDPEQVSVEQLIEALFEIIDPYSLNRQGADVGAKYRTGVYSKDRSHLRRAKEWIFARIDESRIVVEVMPLTNDVKSGASHQERPTR